MAVGRRRGGVGHGCGYLNEWCCSHWVRSCRQSLLVAGHFFLVAVLHVSLLSLWSLSLDRSAADHVVVLSHEGRVLVAAADHISSGILHRESRHPRHGQAKLKVLRAFHVHSHSSVVCPLA